MTKSQSKLPAKKIAKRISTEILPAILDGEEADVSSASREEAKDSKPVRNYRRHAKKVVGGKFANIMVKMAERSEDGSLAHTKYLFEIGGVKEDIHRQKQKKSEPSLAKLLLAEVRKRRGATPAQNDSHPAMTGDPDKR